MVNKVGRRAIELALKYEKDQGRQPIEDKGKKSGYDILSGSLKIEVKGRGGDKEPHVLLSDYNIKAVDKASEKDYRLYVIMNPLKNPKLIIFSKKDVLKRKERMKQWTVPLRMGDFEKGIQLSRQRRGV